MSGKEELNNALHEAQEAVAAGQQWDKTSAEKRLDFVGNSVQSVLVAAAAGGALSSDNTKDALDVIKSKIDTFVEDSKVAIKILDEIGKIHPFVQVAVSAFKVALNFELTRRSNDGKVLALKIKMKEMMSTLYVLNGDQDDKSAAVSLLTERMVKVADSIHECARVCEAYQKQKLMAKVFMSHKWESKFTGVSQQFEEHTIKLRFDLDVHTNRGVVTANQMLARTQADLGRLMKLVFESLLSTDEREVSLFVERHGGSDKVLQDDVLLSNLFEIRRSRSSGPRRPAGLQPAEMSLSDEIQELRKETQKDLEKILEESREAFERKFEAQRAQIEDVRNTVVKEGDRIISTMVSGPHDRIVNKVIYFVWKENHWRASVKAVHLVLALHDHFSQPQSHLLAAQSDALQKISGIVSPSNPESDARKIEEVSAIAAQDLPVVDAKDQWALEYIGVHHVRPLIEAIDVDISSFVSIAEINAFTAARPAEWSLFQWLAYWTVGFGITVVWYTARINVVLAQLELAFEQTLPANRKRVYAFLQALSWVDEVVAGILQAVDASDDADQSRQRLWEEKFRSYVDAEEERMYEILERVRYLIDDESTRILVVQDALPEQYVLPVTFLLLRRARDVVVLSKSRILHDLELESITCSFAEIYFELEKRKKQLQAVLVLHNRDSKEYLRRFYQGMYFYVFEDPFAQGGEHWKRDPYRLAHQYSPELLVETPADPAGKTKAETLLFPSPVVPGLEYYQSAGPTTNSQEQSQATPHEERQKDTVEPRPEETTQMDDTQDSEVQEKPQGMNLLAGYWMTTYVVHCGDDRQHADSFGRLLLDPSDSNHITGFGADSIGDFQLKGSLQGRELTFTKDYGIGEFWWADISCPLWYNYIGLVDEDHQEIRGRWTLNDEGLAYVKTPNDEDPSQSDEGDLVDILTGQDWTYDGQLILGVTFIFRRVQELALLRHIEVPEDTGELELSRPRMLWRLAFDTVLRFTRCNHLCEDALRDRRTRRESYVVLLLERRQNKGRLPLEKRSAWKHIVRANSLEDLRLWKPLAHFYTSPDGAMPFSCNSCGFPITSERYVCLPCSWHEYLTVDMCSDCLDKSFPVKDTVRTSEHVPSSHHLLQLRLDCGTRFGHYFREEARQCIEETKGDDDGGRVCNSCKGAVVQPYWYCLDCKRQGSTTCVCVQCNAAANRDKPWMTEPAWQPMAVHPSGHTWSHKLILFPDSSTTVEKPSVEEQLARLEITLSILKQSQDISQASQEQALSSHTENIATRVETISTRLDALEGLMKEVLLALKKL